MGQLVVMTAPMIGNYGINPEDVESDRPHVAGVIVRELAVKPSNWRATGALADWLSAAHVPIVADVDTRQLTRHIRSRGAMRGVAALGERPDDEVRAALAASPSMDGLDLATAATIGAERSDGPADAASHRRLRLRDEAQHPAPLHPERVPRHSGAGANASGPRPRAPAGRHLPLERPGRPGSGGIRDSYTAR